MHMNNKLSIQNMEYLNFKTWNPLKGKWSKVHASKQRAMSRICSSVLIGRHLQQEKLNVCMKNSKQKIWYEDSQYWRSDIYSAYWKI